MLARPSSEALKRGVSPLVSITFGSCPSTSRRRSTSGRLLPSTAAVRGLRGLPGEAPTVALAAPTVSARTVAMAGYCTSATSRASMGPSCVATLGLAASTSNTCCSITAMDNGKSSSCAEKPLPLPAEAAVSGPSVAALSRASTAGLGPWGLCIASSHFSLRPGGFSVEGLTTPSSSARATASARACTSVLALAPGSSAGPDGMSASTSLVGALARSASGGNGAPR
mmetsp:Transcript_122366/g.380340  ORF Transcript_122366/g.380340 Transcript_122366/m.380340 type:complete len:226 (+) Transcript_122366:906-1583(+)